MTSSYLSAIAIGSNLGNSLQTVNDCLIYLNSIPEIEVRERSHWYCTKAITINQEPSQPDYINGCAILNTTLKPQSLLEVLLDVEIYFGRIRREKWGARTLDLDLLLYEDLILDSPSLIIPHPRMCDRAFVLLPLAEIVPDWIHPMQKEAIAKLALNPPDIELSRPKQIN